MQAGDFENAALILIDVQQAFDELDFWGGNRNNPNAEQNIELLLKTWRNTGLPVFHIKHASLNPASPIAESNPGHQFKKEALPLAEEPIISKHVNSAFIGTNLREQLDDAGIKTLVFVGLTTDHCVSTSVRMAGNFGFKCFLVADATATFDKKGVNGEIYPAEVVHQVSLASLNGEFAEVVSTNDLANTIHQNQKIA